MRFGIERVRNRHIFFTRIVVSRVGPSLDFTISETAEASESPVILESWFGRGISTPGKVQDPQMFGPIPLPH